MNQKTVAAVLLTIACIAVLVFAISFGRGAGDGQENGEDGSNEISGNLLQGEIPLIDNKNAEEPIATSIGIDVSKWQGIIDFQKVRESGIDFVMVRVGYRTAKDGKIEADGNAAYNLQTKNVQIKNVF